MDSDRKLCTPRVIFVVNGVIVIPVIVTGKHQIPERELVCVCLLLYYTRGFEDWNHTFLVLCSKWSPGWDQSSLDRLCCKNTGLMKQ